jgi:quercetin dioxygenase-like cupin family protein
MKRPSVISGTFRGCGLSARKHTFFKAGDVHNGHCHVKDHITLVAQGKVRCEVDGYDPIEVSAPAIITIDKDTLHGFTALTDNTVYYCIFEGDDPGDAAACRDCGGCSLD